MTNFTPDRRSLLKGGATLLAAAATMSSEQLLGYAKAWAQDAQWKPEAGAKINLLRWKRFVEAEDVAFMKIVDAFQKATGVTINVSNESYDDIQPKASVAANTGQGLDMVWGLYTLPFLFPNKCTDMTDVADYLGKKCGGWSASGEAYGKLEGKWIGVPVAATGGLVNYRVAAAEKAGHKEFPKDLGGFADLIKGLNKNGTPAGMALGHASGDANGWLHWALWAHGGNLIDKDNKVVINSPETAKSLEYVKGLYDNFIPGTASWNDSSNNKAFLAGQLYPDHQRHLDLCHGENGKSADRRGHEPRPSAGGRRRQDPRTASRLPDPGLQLHQVPAGLQGVHRLHDGTGRSSIPGSSRRRAICRRSCSASRRTRSGPRTRRTRRTATWPRPRRPRPASARWAKTPRPRLPTSFWSTCSRTTAPAAKT